MNRKIHYKTVQQFYKEKFNTDIDVKSFENNVTGEIYDVVFENGTDIALFSRRDNDGFGDYICLNSNGDKIAEDKIFGYVNSAYTTYENGEIIFSERDLELHFRDETISIEDLIKREIEMFPERTGIILKTTGLERKPIWKGLMDFHVDEIMYADEEEFENIMDGNDSELIKDYNRRTYGRVGENETHGLLVINKNTGDGLMIGSSGADYGRYMTFAPKIEISAEIMLEEKMKREAVIEMRLYSPLFVSEHEKYDDEMLDVNPSYHFNDIRKSVFQENLAEGERGLANWFGEDDICRKKVYSIKPDIERVNGKVMGVAVVKITKPLDEKELSNLKDYITGQYADGWGESYEQHEIHSDGKEIYVHFWNDTEYYIKSEAELNEEQEQCQQMQGMDEMRM